MLYIVATPIGNLKDITLRALEVLQSVDSIICEDTRRASILLNHYQIPFGHSRPLRRSFSEASEGGNPINKSLIVLNDYNEAKMVESIIRRLKSGENFALISDAGTPLVSDPGYKLVRSCIENGIQIDSIPGSSSLITALTLSGLPPDKFLFLGYPPEKPGQRMQLFKSLTLIHESIRVTYIAFVSPYKLLRTLQDMREVLGDIDIVLAHELTKIHQSVDKKKISEWLETLKNPKGEYILLFRI